MMTRVLRLSSLPLLFCLMALPSRSQVSAAETEYAKGMLARQKDDFNGAFAHLQRAVDLDPSMTKAHFALGLTAQDRCVPQSNPRRDMAAIAIQEYKKVLELDPSHAEASMNLAYLSYLLDQRDEAERYYRKALALRPDDAEAACGVAALIVQRGWADVTQTRNKLMLPLKKPLIDLPSCREARQRNLAGFEESLALLTRALEVSPENMDLMAFLSFLYTGRAEIQCGNHQAYKADKAAARKWDRMEKEMFKKREPGHVFPSCPPPPPPMPDRS